MKKVILLALICMSVIACDKKDAAVLQNEVQSASIPYRKAATMSIAGADLKVDVREIVDTRCPKDVLCITLGDVKINFNISDGANQTDLDFTVKGDKKADFQVFKLGDKEFILRVSEVSPYPISNLAPKLEDYKVDLSIERK
jgi:hypothetical protein